MPLALRVVAHSTYPRIRSNRSLKQKGCSHVAAKTVPAFGSESSYTHPRLCPECCAASCPAGESRTDQGAAVVSPGPRGRTRLGPACRRPERPVSGRPVVPGLLHALLRHSPAPAADREGALLGPAKPPDPLGPGNRQLYSGGAMPLQHF